MHYGKQQGALTMCPKHSVFFPSAETCPWCEPEAPPEDQDDYDGFYSYANQHPHVGVETLRSMWDAMPSWQRQLYNGYGVSL